MNCYEANVRGEPLSLFPDYKPIKYLYRQRSLEPASQRNRRSEADKCRFSPMIEKLLRGRDSKNTFAMQISLKPFLSKNCSNNSRKLSQKVSLSGFDVFGYPRKGFAHNHFFWLVMGIRLSYLER